MKRWRLLIWELHAVLSWSSSQDPNATALLVCVCRAFAQLPLEFDLCRLAKQITDFGADVEDEEQA